MTVCMNNLPERFKEKILPITESGCWLWMSALAGSDYPYVTLMNPKRLRRAHRVVYEMLKERIPEGLQLDHLCRVRACVNPDHLEPVTGQENRRRAHVLVTHCKHGHEFTGDNVRIWKRTDRAGIKRQCTVCERIKYKKLVARKEGGLLREIIDNKTKTHCPNNHPYAGSNLMIDKKGKRSCKICHNLRSKKWHEDHYKERATRN